MLPIEPRLGADRESVRRSLHTSEKVEAQESATLEAKHSQDNTGNFPIPIMREERSRMPKSLASSTPWVSPFKARHIRKNQKLSKVVAHATHNLERPGPQSFFGGSSYGMKDQKLLGEGVILQPSALTPDPEEYRVTSVQGSRMLPQLASLGLDKQS